MRAFVRGALIAGTGGMIVPVYQQALMWISGSRLSLLPSRAETFFSIAPWMLAGGVVGLFVYFLNERRVQFSIRLLLLITLLFSFAGTWGILASDRYRIEKEASFTLLKELRGGGISALGIPSFVVEIHILKKTVDSEAVSFIISQLELFPRLFRVTFVQESISDSDLATLRTAFPDILFVEE